MDWRKASGRISQKTGCWKFGGGVSVAALAAFVLALLIQPFVAGPAFAAREIRSIAPNPARAGSGIDIRGTGFGLDERRVVYGAPGQARILGDFPVRSGGWSDALIRCTVPTNTAPGTYWVGLARSDGGLQSNRFEPFRVSGSAGGGTSGAPSPRDIMRGREERFREVGRPKGRLQDPRANDLAIVGVTPAQGATVRSNRGKVTVTARVRNQGLQEKSFAITAGEGRTASGPLGTRIPTGQLIKSESATARPGQTVDVPIGITVGSHSDIHGAFQARLGLTHAGGGIPGTYFDDDNSNNALDVRYQLEPVAYNVSATLTKMKIRDDCDDVSKGDWIVEFSARGWGRDREEIVGYAGWPPGDRVSNVDSGETRAIGETIRIGGLYTNSPVVLKVQATDCDSDTLIPWQAIEGFGCIKKCKCGGEEVLPIPEQSGSNDFAGEARVSLAASEWKEGGSFSETSGSGDCGRGAYVAYFDVSSSPIY